MTRRTTYLASTLFAAAKAGSPERPARQYHSGRLIPTLKSSNAPHRMLTHPPLPVQPSSSWCSSHCRRLGPLALLTVSLNSFFSHAAFRVCPTDILEANSSFDSCGLGIRSSNAGISSSDKTGWSRLTALSYNVSYWPLSCGVERIVAAASRRHCPQKVRRPRNSPSLMIASCK